MNRRSPHPSPWRDTPDRHGRVSRILHWLTAGQVTLLFAVTLAWLLLILIVGHVLLALAHRLWREDAVFSRLTGPLEHRGHAPAHPDAHRAG
ncbi:hypothetical protein F0A17_08485 [Billgrantia pellis]|uniref:Uncharacterized protein n=1 Tax=Billgrantia pellis TaxID=2606936 RepID=A0A7V7G431_9GAMM|nr:hypothetical protein [Halomonas pellis]KAA0012955.1 hypothetical protein F0A17_08485 [Halomonas pellis]